MFDCEWTFHNIENFTIQERNSQNSQIWIQNRLEVGVNLYKSAGLRSRRPSSCTYVYKYKDAHDYKLSKEIENAFRIVKKVSASLLTT